MSKILPLAQFIAKHTPGYSEPKHLKPLTDAFEAFARGETVREAFSTPPGHGKSEVLVSAIPWLHHQMPDLRIGLAYYAQRFGERQGRKVRDGERRAGIPLATDSKSRREIHNTHGGFVYITSKGGSVTGEHFDLIICDDLLKGRAEAESLLARDSLEEWFVSDLMPRLEPGGSFIYPQMRLHVDDLIARLVARGEVKYTNLPALALDDDPLGRKPGEPLWSERWSKAELLKIQKSLGGPESYEWLSMYQGNPLGRGSRVFSDLYIYDSKPPIESLKISIGIDFAYSTKTSSDFSVAVVIGNDGSDFYVLDVQRVRLEPREFRARVKLLCATYKKASVTAYVGAAEQGSVEFFREAGIPIRGIVVAADKFTRCIPVAAAWNSGRILVPRSAPWLDAFSSEVAGFTGNRDRHDDIVDALAAAFDALQKGRASKETREAADLGNARLHGGLRTSSSPFEPPLFRGDESPFRWGSSGGGRGFG